MNLPPDLQTFLNWYLSPRAHMKRGVFNVVFLLAFVPVLIIQINTGLHWLEGASAKSATVLDMMDELRHMQGSTIGQTGQLGGEGDYQTGHAAGQLLGKFQELGDNFNQADESQGWQVPWADILSFLAYLFLVPIVAMRLRDMGKRGQQVWVWTGWIYASVILGLVASTGIPVATSLNILAGIITFFGLGYLCSAKTSRRTPAATVFTAQPKHPPPPDQ